MRKETTVELSEKPAADVQVPVVAYLRADSHGNPIWTDDCVCQEPIYPSDPEGSDASDISMPMVRQADAQVALVAKDAEIAALKKKVGAYQLLTKSQDVRIATVRQLRDEAGEAIAAFTTASTVNTMLTNQIVALKTERDALKVATEGECKPSLYLFWSEHGGIRYWTRDAVAAARKAIEFGTEPERLYAATVPAPVQTAAQYLSGSDMADLRQLDEEFSAGGGWCLPKARMKRLAELGVIRHGGGGHYSITSFGSLILGGGFFRLPLETVEECNARIGKEHTAITAQ